MKRPHAQKRLSVPNIQKEKPPTNMWSPPGILIDTSVIGSIINCESGGKLGPIVYPLHIAPEPIPTNSIMAPPAHPNNNHRVPKEFEEYMWMENEKEFEKEVFKQLEEEELMEECMEAMLEDEEYERLIAFQKEHQISYDEIPINELLENLTVNEFVSKSKLNPFAKEFVPRYARLPPEIPPHEIQEIEAAAAETADKEITQNDIKSDSNDNDIQEFPEDSREVSEDNATGINHNKKQKKAKKGQKLKAKSKKCNKSKNFCVKTAKKAQPKKRKGRKAGGNKGGNRQHR